MARFKVKEAQTVLKVSVERLEGSKVSLSVEVPASVVDTSLDRAYKTVVKRVNVPGFRRGKAPRYLLERYFGKEILNDEAMRGLLPEQYALAVDEAKIEPVDEPDFDDVHFTQGEPMTFKATVSVRPEVILEDYSDISVPYEVQPVTYEAIQAQIDYIKGRMTELRPMEEDQILEEGDIASCHVREIEGGNGMDRDLPYIEVGRDNPLVPGLGEALRGMKKGEEIEFTGTYPPEDETVADETAAEDETAADETATKDDDSPPEAKSARFHVEVKACYKKHEPTEEEFLKNSGKTTLDEVKEEIRTALETAHANAARRQHSDRVEEAILARAKVEIPGVMIERKQEELFRDLAERLQGMGSSIGDYLRETGRDYRDILEAYKNDAEKEVKRELVLDALSVKEGVNISQEAIDDVIQAIARQTGKDAQSVKTTMELRGGLAGIERPLLRMEVLKKIAIEAAARAGTPLPSEASETSEEEPKAAEEHPEAAGEQPEAQPKAAEEHPEAQPAASEGQPEAQPE